MQGVFLDLIGCAGGYLGFNWISGWGKSNRTGFNHSTPGDYTAVQYHQRRLLRLQGGTRANCVGAKNLGECLEAG